MYIFIHKMFSIPLALEVNVVPEKSVVDLGKDASFDCVATGNGLKGIKWEMEGNEKLGPTAVSPLFIEHIKKKGVRTYV